jgi:hypothetical protein
MGQIVFSAFAFIMAREYNTIFKKNKKYFSASVKPHLRVSVLVTKLELVNQNGGSI